MLVLFASVVDSVLACWCVSLSLVPLLLVLTLGRLVVHYHFSSEQSDTTRARYSEIWVFGHHGLPGTREESPEWLSEARLVALCWRDQFPSKSKAFDSISQVGLKTSVMFFVSEVGFVAPRSSENRKIRRRGSWERHSQARVSPGPHLANFGSMVGRHRAHTCRCKSMLGPGIDQDCWGVDQSWPDVGQLWPETDQTRPNSGRSRLRLA